MIPPRSLKPLSRRFLGDRSGQVAYLFGLMVIPVLCAVGAGLDYGRQRSAKVRLDSALDAAVLSVASRKTNTFNESEVRTTLDEQFRKQVANLPQTTILKGRQGFDVKVTTTKESASIKASYAAEVATTALTRLMGFDAMSLSGTATASRNFDQYMDFYLLLDNSPSMGLAATSDDIIKLADKTGGCAFACHEHVWSGNTATGDKLTSNYYIARNNNVRLRIDNVVKAAQDLTDYAKKDALLPDQYRMAVYSFSDIFTKVAPLTTDLSNVKAKAGAITLAYSYKGDPDNQTSYIRALPKIAAEIPSSGTGLTPDSPVRFLFFVTDGVQDAPLDGKTLTAFDKRVPNKDRFIGAIDPQLCKSLKDRGIRIGIIYTTYLPLDSGKYYNQWYMDYVNPFRTTAPDNLKSCASEGLFYPVTTDGDITKAMIDLFRASVSSVRLTN